MADRQVDRLRSIAIGAPRAPETSPFYRDVWGLEPVGRQSGAIYLRGTGPEHHLLSLHDRRDRCLVRIDLGASSPEAVDEIYANCQAKGVRLLNAPAAIAEPGGGYGFDLVDLEGRLLRVVAETELQDEKKDSLRPRKLSHIVLNTAQFEAAQDFYKEVLGFRISDWSEDTIAFLRCSNDHHSIAFFRNQHASINHIAFDMEDIDSLMRGVGRMSGNGHLLKWGVGRHGPGNNVFAYFTDPNGFVIEYTCFLDQIDARNHIPRVWQRVPEQLDRWGTSGPPSQDIRAAMLGVADPGFEA
jgi:catechol 2,3-dioxygenase-like lactoylglutathione lyase family enzyme